MSQSDPSEQQANDYALEFIKSKDMSKSFKAAFPKSNANTNSTYCKASLLHKSAKIQSRIEELSVFAIEEAKKKCSVTFDEVVEMLVDAARKGSDLMIDKDGNKHPFMISATINACCELSKMYGYHAATRFKIGGDEEAIPISVQKIPDDNIGAVRAYREIIEG